MTTVNPVQTTTYDLIAGNNPTTFGLATNIDVSAGYAVSGDGSADWTVTNAGLLTGSGVAVSLASQSTVINQGTIACPGSYGHGGGDIKMQAGGTVINRLGAVMSGIGGVVIYGGAATVRNSGTIDGGLSLEADLAGTAVVLNNAGALISGQFGVDIQSVATVTNAGSIHATGLDAASPAGVAVGGGTVFNKASESISGATDGVYGVGPTTVINAGTILGTLSDGVRLSDGGRITNLAGASINASGGNSAGVYVPFGSAVTVTNFGTISGGGASVLFASATDTLIVEAGAKFIGVAGGGGGSTLELGGGAGTISVLGIMRYLAGSTAMTFTGFGTIAIDAGASWTLARASDLYNVKVGGTLTNLGGLVGDSGATASTGKVGGIAVALRSGGTVINRATITGGTGGYGFTGGAGGVAAELVAPASLVNTGTISGGAGGFGKLGTNGRQGLGVVLAAGGAVTNGSVANHAAIIEGGQGLVASATGAATVTNFGTIEGAGGAALTFGSASDVLNLEAGSAFVGAVNGGGGTLVLASGTGTLSGLANKAVTVAGIMAATTFANFGVIKVAAVASFTDAGAVSLGAGQSLINAGTLKLGSSVSNSGVLAAAGGTLTVSGPVTGAGAVQISAGLAHFAGTLAENVSFTGTSGVLELDHSQTFAATISGFSKTGGTSLDLSDIAFTSGVTKASYVGTTTSGVLSVTDGAHTATIKLSGDYTTSTFTVSSDGHGGTTVVDPATTNTPAAKPSATVQGVAAGPFIQAMAAFTGPLASYAIAPRYASAGFHPLLLAPRTTAIA